MVWRGGATVHTSNTGYGPVTALFLLLHSHLTQWSLCLLKTDTRCFLSIYSYINVRETLHYSSYKHSFRHQLLSLLKLINKQTKKAQLCWNHSVHSLANFRQNGRRPNGVVLAVALELVQTFASVTVYEKRKKRKLPCNWVTFCFCHISKKKKINTSKR